MKLIRLLPHLFFGIWLTGLALSCSSDDESQTIAYYRSYATVKGTPDNFELLLDDAGIKLVISESIVFFQPDEVIHDRRVRALYSILKEEPIDDGVTYFISLYSLEDIECKIPLYSSDVDGDDLANDPIGILFYWFGGKYLNFFYSYAGIGQTDHTIDIWVNEDHPESDEDNIYIEIRHNAFGEKEEKEQVTGLISFNLSSFLNEDRTSVEVHMSYVNNKNQIISQSIGAYSSVNNNSGLDIF